MSKYGFNIRRLISTKRTPSPNGVEDYDSDASEQSAPAFSRGMRRPSWFTTLRPQSRTQPPTPAISRAQSPLPSVSDSKLSPPTDETPQSSASSLYSYDEGSLMNAGTKRSTLCSIGGSELSLQISSATSVEGDDFSPAIKNNGKHLRLMKKQASSTRSRLDLTEALSLDPKDKGAQVRGATPGDLIENANQAIQETDPAPKECGHPLAQVDATRMSFNETPKLPPSTIKRQLSRRATVQPRLKNKYRLSITRTQVSPATSVRRKPSVAKNQRKNSTKKRQMKTQRKPLGVKNTNKNNSKWTENVSGLLSGKLFQKIEADEMVTPAQIEAYKLRRLSKLQLQDATSSETSLSLDGDTVETPVEPFHLDDLPSRIGSSGVELTANTPVDEKPDPMLMSEASISDISLDCINDDDESCLDVPLPASASTSPVASPVSSDGIATNPQTQMKSPSRYMFRKIPGLPTISESNFQDDELSSAHGTGKEHANPDHAHYLFLRSTPHTMTAPRHRHGPIRLAKADLFPEPKLGADDGLDWTAFQMAISGGAGEYFTDNDHITRQQEVEDVEDICRWWDNWDFRGHGRLVRRDDMPETPSTISADEDLLYREIGRDNPYSARHKWRSLQRKAASEGRKLDLDLSKGDKLYNGGGIKKWSIDGHASRLMERGSMASLPQSPMLDLRVITSDNGDVDYVPMGYNISHDLNDFLNWEAKNVYSNNAMYDGGVI